MMENKLKTDLKPPVARIEPKKLEKHGHIRIDNYDWLRDDTREDPDVLAYLEAENAYTEAVLAHTKEFRNSLFEE